MSPQLCRRALATRSRWEKTRRRITRMRKCTQLSTSIFPTTPVPLWLRSRTRSRRFRRFDGWTMNGENFGTNPCSPLSEIRSDWGQTRPGEPIYRAIRLNCPLGYCSGKEVALPPVPPLRTGRETFASSGSSRTKAPRERSRFHNGFGPGFSSREAALPAKPLNALD
jgi:hypothetical protein